MINSRVDSTGTSKALSFPSLLKVIKGYLRLVKDCYIDRNKMAQGHYSADALTARRHKKLMADDDLK
tara:strand:+ start:6238 stop:6438 length:201 start_codon:yes stop_codon:yes gene_type:complete